MARVRRDVPLPEAMQGRWLVAEEPSELLVEGGEVTCFGATVEYDWKEIETQYGALTVSMGVDDPRREDTFSRANITGLVITPEGEFLGYNVKFACLFVRPD
ncbi:MAG: hypothetical protein JO013_03540 [Alphaproteobacteria bacterium]|nr:hypothetical protein [Alphaproteobacteria bacterium]